jgi:hypothetical protein
MKTIHGGEYTGLDLYDYRAYESGDGFSINIGSTTLHLVCRRRGDTYDLAFESVVDYLNMKKYVLNDASKAVYEFSCTGKGIVLFSKDKVVDHISIEYVEDDFEIWFCDKSAKKMVRVRIPTYKLVNFFMKAVHKEVISFLKEVEKNAERMRLCLEKKGRDYV